VSAFDRAVDGKKKLPVRFHGALAITRARNSGSDA
jgi:hypothetical protein